MRFAVLAAGIAALWTQPAMAGLWISVSGSGYGYDLRTIEPYPTGPYEATFSTAIQFNPAQARPFGGGLLYTHQDREKTNFGLTTLSVFVKDDLLLAWGSEENYRFETFAFSLQFVPGYLSSTFPTSFDPEMFVGGSFQGIVEYEYPRWDGWRASGPISTVAMWVGPPPLYNPVYSGTDIFLTYDTLAVPEPATWAMMLTGFAVLGAGLRRRKPTVRYSFS